MKVLPPSTALPKQPHRRRHQPPQAAGERGYKAYRECLRWDFGFSCSFCLLHEHDVLAEGDDGWGVWTIEHFVLQTDDADRANAYFNCYWCCRRCNLSRDSRRITTLDGALLDPCVHAWSDRFQLKHHRLEPRHPHDRNAQRTWSVYNFDDPGKVKRRQKREEALVDAVALWREMREIWARLSPADQSFHEDVRTMQRNQRLALGVLLRYLAIPESSTEPCTCGSGEHCRLPRWLDAQCTELDETTE